MGYMSPDIPDPTDPYSDYLAGYQAQAETYPAQRYIEMLYRTGGKGDGRFGVTADFTGQGDADYQKQYTDQMAGAMLALQKQYGAQFVEQKLKELELADPEGVAQRKKLWSDIQADLGRVDERRKLAEANQASILAELEKGSTLDPEMEREVNQATKGRQAARGIILGPATQKEQAGDVLAAGNAVKAQRQQRALAFLTSGKTPEDIEYQNTQQGMANLGAFVAGETPQAQFGNLRGASQGAAPFVSGGTPQGSNQQAGSQAISYNNSVWNTNTQVAANQANPYLAGLGTGFSVFNLMNMWQGSNSGTAAASSGGAGPAY